MEQFRITDLVRQAGGWPINLDAVCVVLARADRVFKGRGGRDYNEALTDSELEQMGFSRPK